MKRNSPSIQHIVSIQASKGMPRRCARIMHPPAQIHLQWEEAGRFVKHGFNKVYRCVPSRAYA
jgi:hypothetical protein